MAMASKPANAEAMRTFVVRYAEARGEDAGRIQPVAAVASAHEAVGAYVSDGRWVADCPDAQCNGAMYLLDRATPFMCAECLNADVQGRWRPVDWPSVTDETEIEAALMARPRRETRHWSGIDRPGLPAQTPADLRAENAARGI